MRIITDPIVDSLVFLVIQFVLPFLLGIVRRVVRISLFSGLLLLSEIFGQEKVNESFQSLIGVVCLSSFSPLA